MLLVDTNVVAYLLIHGDHTEAAQELRRRDSDWRSEALLLVEFTNVLASSIASRQDERPPRAGLPWQRPSTLLDGKLISIAHASALSMAVSYRVTAYDARFLALAQQLDRRLVTEDAKLRAAAPKLTQSLADALATG